MIERTWHVDLVPIDDVRPHPRNYREHDLGSIDVSIRTFSNYLPLVVQRSTGYVLAGNGRWHVLKAQGAAEVPVRYLDVSDSEAEAILLADNWIPRRARDVDQELLDLMLSLKNEDEDLFRATGIEDDDVEALEREIADLDKPLKLDSRDMLPKKKVITCPECGHKFEAKR